MSKVISSSGRQHIWKTEVAKGNSGSSQWGEQSRLYIERHLA